MGRQHHPQGEPGIVTLENVVKRFDALTVLNGVSLKIREGEFFTLLGPSGSGKTTMLRLISGFEQPNDGRIVIEGKDVAGTPPHHRDVNTVFQDYALFPHMTVLDNILYGPLAKRVARSEAMGRAREALDMVKLAHVADRRPGQLSGGQRQRIAMARAIVNRPRVLLLDEPLGALDLKLRHEMQFELQRIQRQLGITFIYVTHDQEEALAMSDRIAVFDRGRIAQVGTPRDLYQRPANRFVAEFVGVSNLLTRNGVQIMIRPERVSLHREAPRQEGTHIERGRLVERTYVGMVTRYLVRLDDGDVIQAAVLDAGDEGDDAPSRDEAIWVSWRDRDIIAIPKEAEQEAGHA